MIFFFGNEQRRLVREERKSRNGAHRALETLDPSTREMDAALIHEDAGEERHGG
jgi:hypothetical protein